MAETRRIAELDSNGTLKPDQVPADVVHQADLGAAASMSPVEVVTDPAAQAALSGAFAPVGAPTRLWVSALDFTLTTGGAAITTKNRWPVWLLDAATTEIVTASVIIPPGWTTFHVDLWWTNMGAGSGNVQLRYSERSVSDGGTLTSPPTITNQTFTAPAEGIVEVTRVATDRPVAAASLYIVEMDRRGADANDTLTNDIGCLGLMLSKA